jgi:hypothetical protein
MYTLESVRPDNSTQAGKSKAKKKTVDSMIKKKKAAAGSDVDEDEEFEVKKAPRPIKVSAPKAVAPAADFFAPKSKKLGSNDEVSTASSSKSKKVATKKEKDVFSFPTDTSSKKAAVSKKKSKKEDTSASDETGESDFDDEIQIPITKAKPARSNVTRKKTIIESDSDVNDISDDFEMEPLSKLKKSDSSEAVPLKRSSPPRPLSNEPAKKRALGKKAILTTKPAAKKKPIRIDSDDEAGDATMAEKDNDELVATPKAVRPAVRSKRPAAILIEDDDGSDDEGVSSDDVASFDDDDDGSD